MQILVLDAVGREGASWGSLSGAGLPLHAERGRRYIIARRTNKATIYNVAILKDSK
jgi:hypothetical protein